MLYFALAASIAALVLTIINFVITIKLKRR